MPILNFDASQIEPSSPLDPIPAGKYVAEITASDLKPTKKGDGTYLELEFTVLQGEFKGRKVWDRLCLRHPNVQAKEIAESNLAAICRAVGQVMVKDSVQLHHRPLQIRVKCKQSNVNDEIYNEIKGYEKVESQHTAPPVERNTFSAVESTDSTPATDQNVPPWAR